MKSILVTGAASGIGLAAAQRFAAQGWRVGMADVNMEALRRQASMVEGQVETLAMDVTDAGSVERALATFCRDGQSLDVLLNSAGILEMRCFGETPLQRLQQIVDVNLMGVIHCIHAALPHLSKTSKMARVITMGSASGIYGIPEEAVYSATKFAVRGLTEALNIELEGQNVWVCDVMVAYVKTPMIEQAERVAKSVDLLGFSALPEEVAEVIWQAANEQRVHWHVGGADVMQTKIETSDEHERRSFISTITGFADAA